MSESIFTDICSYPPVSDWLLNCDLYLTSIGQMRYEPGANYPNGGHPSEYQFSWEAGRRLNDYALVWISDGEGELEFTKGQSQPFTQGEVIYLVPGAWHRYRPKFETGWSEHWICLNGAHLHRLRLHGYLGSQNCSLGLQRDAEWQQRYRDLMEEVSSARDDNQLSWGATGLSIFTDAGSDLPRQSPHAPSGSKSGRLLDRALTKIRENSHRPFTVKDLGDRLHTSTRTLERHFAKMHCRSPQHEIIHVRLERARRLLTNSDLQIKEIAYICGFGSAKLMNYNFRKLLHSTPGEVRARALKSAI